MKNRLYLIITVMAFLVNACATDNIGMAQSISYEEAGHGLSSAGSPMQDIDTIPYDATYSQ